MLCHTEITILDRSKTSELILNEVHRYIHRHHHYHQQQHLHHLERERLVELGRHVALDYVSSSCLDGRVLTHQRHLRVEVCV